MRLGSLLQQLTQPLYILLTQPAWPTDAPRAAQALGSLLMECIGPASYRFAADTDLSGDIRLRPTVLQQLPRFQSSSFQFLEVSLDSRCISHAHNIGPLARFVTILCRDQ